MDNDTIVGLIVGESAATHAPQRGLPPHTLRTVVLTVALIGSNAPDLDLLVDLRGSSHRNLDYLLWHRGYTHTVLGGLALVLILYACTALVLRVRHLAPSREDRLLLLGTAGVTTALHLAMDYLNSYGVHVFWPLDDRWQYGDRVFIVEPLYWMAAAPLLMRLHSVASRLLLGGAIVGVIVVGLSTHMMSGLSCGVLGFGFIALAAWGGRLSPAHAARLSLLLAVAVTGAFALAGREASRLAEVLTADYFSHDRLLDHVLTPQLANPLCWDLLLLTTSGDGYITRHAVLSLAPTLLGAGQCTLSRPVTHVAPMTPVPLNDSRAVHWIGQMTLSRSLLERVVAGDCNAAAFMLFARAPFLADITLPGATPQTLLGDLRFDRGSEGDPFGVPVTPGPRNACRRAAPWNAPRADLLEAKPP